MKTKSRNIESSPFDTTMAAIIPTKRPAVRYAADGKIDRSSTPSQPLLPGAAHLLAQQLGTLDESVLYLVSKKIGRKQLAYELGIHKSMVDQMLSGAKHDPIARAERLLLTAVKHCGVAVALSVPQYFLQVIREAVKQ